MDENSLRALLAGVRSGSLDLDSAVDRLKRLPFDALGYAMIDNGFDAGYHAHLINRLAVTRTKEDGVHRPL